jgi:ribose 5-phosphate isomerase B
MARICSSLYPRGEVELYPTSELTGRPKRLGALRPRRENTMHLGIAADHGGFDLKQRVVQDLEAAGHQVEDYGAHKFVVDDDYPDFVVPMARAVARGEIARGIAICGSGVGACIAANKIRGVRAALIMDSFSAHQGVEDDDMNVICLGERVVGHLLALELIRAFLGATFKKTERFHRRLRKLAALETEERQT